MSKKNTTNTTTVENTAVTTNTTTSIKKEDTTMKNTTTTSTVNTTASTMSAQEFKQKSYGTFIDEPFSMDRYEETMDWIDQTIQAIKEEKDWLVSSSGYFCRVICSTRLHCPVGEEIIHSGKKE